MPNPKVVIIGAGFGGLQCARALDGAPVEVLLIDRNNYHLFTPLLYQVAGSLLNPSDIAYPIRRIFRGSPNVRFRLAEIEGVDFSIRTVQTADGAGISFDFLVIAAGSRTNYFGIESARRYSHGLKDLPEALRLRSHVLHCFETAARTPELAERQKWLAFVIVGAGPTGVEYAGALSELVRVMRRDFPELDVREVKITLLDAMGQVLPSFPAELGEKARAGLESRGIEVRLKARVESASPDAVHLSGGTTLHAKTLLWTAGVRPCALASRLGLPLHPSGRLRVSQTLEIDGRPRVYAVGDIASFHQDGGEVPMLATPAMQQARHAALNILRSLRREPLLPFRYRDPGIMATIGRNTAVARLRRLSLSGFAGWIVWLFVHLYFIIGFRNRLWVLLGWAWDYLSFDRPIRLISRPDQSQPSAKTPP